MITNSTEFVDTVVIGGGQAGLAIGNELARQGRDFIILDAGERVGNSGAEIARDIASSLYFLGLEFLFAFSSATITGIGRDARYFAKRMRPQAAVHLDGNPRPDRVRATSGRTS